MKEINYININNFSEWVDSQLEFYSDVKFKNKNFTIDNLCNAD
jgi:CRISPR/Cas system CSM-associated protein Csm4 (group 5 of RAMP superfamily)